MNAIITGISCGHCTVVDMLTHQCPVCGETVVDTILNQSPCNDENEAMDIELELIKDFTWSQKLTYCAVKQGDADFDYYKRMETRILHDYSPNDDYNVTAEQMDDENQIAF